MPVSKMSKLLALSGLSLLAAVSVGSAAVTVTVNPAVMTAGYMNVFELPAPGGGLVGAYVFGSGWGQADLDSSFNGSVLTLGPSGSIDRGNDQSEFWWGNPAGTITGNKIMAANYYAESDALAGEEVTFKGTILSNTLVSPYVTSIFIKDFAADYSSNTSVIIPATVGDFSITLQTTGGAGHHIQYGFETLGPNARQAALPSLGNVQIAAAVPEPGVVGVMGVAMMAMVGRRRR